MDDPTKGELVDAMTMVYAGMNVRGLFSGKDDDYWYGLYDAIVEVLELAPEEEDA